MMALLLAGLLLPGRRLVALGGRREDGRGRGAMRTPVQGRLEGSGAASAACCRLQERTQKGEGGLWNLMLESGGCSSLPCYFNFQRLSF